MSKQQFVCFSCSILIVLSCNRVDDSNTGQQSTQGDKSIEIDTVVDVELMYRFEGDQFAKDLQKIFSEYYSSTKSRKNTRDFFHEESLSFMNYPQASQNMRLFYEARFFDVHKPMISAIFTQNNDTIVKLNFIRVDSLGVATNMATINFGITVRYNDLQLINMLYLNSRQWQTEQVGHITYFFPKTHEFSHETAYRMRDFNLHLATLFEMNPMEFKYFVCESNIELMQLQGFDYSYDMFNMNNSSGLSDPTNKIVYAGNRSEYYPHELVHLYTRYWGGGLKYHEWFDEGLATYFGGSRGKPLEYHLVALAEYLRKNDYPDISDPFALPHQVSHDTGTMYAIGGLICKIVFEKGGMDEVWRLFVVGKSDEDFYKAIENVLGVNKAGLSEFLYEHLKQYLAEKDVE